ncbi:MAG: phosphoglucosamine mutase [Xanthomonadales bacterium]|nr:phosphoglucosamine mutase [Xanthomonadales bacterium]
MARKYFGTDGIRGRVGQWPVTAEFMLKLGWAAGRVLGNGAAAPLIVIGKDTRISGYMFEAALEAGLVAAGADVRMLGPVPTPAVAYLTQSLRASAGIVISASHNPYQDNGIKFFSADGEKLADAVEVAIEAELEKPFETVESARLGKAARVEDAVGRYCEFVKGTVREDLNLRGLHIVLDCAHGATYQAAPRVFRELGARLTLIGDAPDGLNINHQVGSTAPQALARQVLAVGADLGIAFDGDGDRVQMVDATGRLVDGDDIVHVLASRWHDTGELSGPVVGTLMTNYGLEQAFGRAGIEFLRTDVGDRHVHRALVARGGTLGGEASGHILCLDRASTGDGMVSALAVLEALADSGRTLAEAAGGWTRYPQTTVNVPVTGNARALVASASVEAARAAAEQQLAGRGRIVLRPSGTEPVVRVTVEAADPEEVRAVVTGLAAAVQSAA